MDNSNLEAGDGFLAELRGGRADGTWHYSAGPVNQLTIAHADALRGERWSATYRTDGAASRQAGHPVMIHTV
ncbi:MAG TPA: hypothetical protein VFK56_05070 [Mycobacterium sp.]|nr:hypothetical protein [Mycobacterium sp.]